MLERVAFSHRERHRHLRGDLFRQALAPFHRDEDQAVAGEPRDERADVIRVAGRRVLVGWPLLGSKTFLGRPAGHLIPVDTSGQDKDPGENDLGARVQLYYVDSTG